MTELSKEEKNAYWTTIKTGWTKIKDHSISESDKDETKKQINEAQKALGLDITEWDQKKTLGDPTFTMSTGQKLVWKKIEFKQFKDSGKRESLKNEIRQIFEAKNLVEEVATKEFPEYATGVGVGQALNLLTQKLN